MQRPLSNQILTATLEVFDYCLEEIKHIHVSFISKEDTDLTRKKLEERFSNTNTLPGTRSKFTISYPFLPLSLLQNVSQLTMCTPLHLSTALVRKQKLQILLFAAMMTKCGLTRLVDIIEKEHQDGRIKFMHPHYPANSYYWPKKEDILCIIEATCTATGCQYHLQGTAVTCIEDQLRKQQALENM